MSSFEEAGMITFMDRLIPLHSTSPPLPSHPPSHSSLLTLILLVQVAVVCKTLQPGLDKSGASPP